MRALGVSVLATASLVAGCAFLPNADDTSPKLTQVPDIHGATFLLDPWPYDAVTAFLCLEQPGEAFTSSHIPDASAGCVPLTVSLDGHGLAARFDIGRVPAQLRDAFGASQLPWYLAVTGSRGSSSETLVTEIDASPIPSDAGPS